METTAPVGCTSFSSLAHTLLSLLLLLSSPLSLSLSSLSLLFFFDALQSWAPDWVFVCASVGDCKAFLCSNGVIAEITQGNRKNVMDARYVSFSLSFRLLLSLFFFVNIVIRKKKRRKESTRGANDISGIVGVG